MSASVLLLLAAAAGLGVYLRQWHQQGQRKPLLIGLHLLLGLGGLEGMLMLLHGAPNGEPARTGSLGTLGLLLLGVAAMSGLGASAFRRQSRRSEQAVLLAHLGAGLGGFLLFLVWMAGS